MFGTAHYQFGVFRMKISRLFDSKKPFLDNLHEFTVWAGSILITKATLY
jgi:hypothetical protein